MFKYKSGGTFAHLTVIEKLFLNYGQKVSDQVHTIYA